MWTWRSFGGRVRCHRSKQKNGNTKNNATHVLRTFPESPLFFKKTRRGETFLFFYALRVFIINRAELSNCVVELSSRIVLPRNKARL